MMMLSQAAEATRGQLHGGDACFTAVSKDTRSLAPGELYVAIRGERFDGHGFVERARQAGAAGALVQQLQDSALAQIRVADTRIALGELAADWRRRFDGVLIGLTGSNGKTTVKEMCRFILQQQADAEAVLATEGNLNNDIGVPMTLLRLRRQHRYAVIEMGANHIGEIDYLTHIARPDIAILNNAGAAHLEGFGGIENVARAKAEIFNGLSDNGTAIINLDDAFADMWLAGCRNRNTMTFSAARSDADVSLQNNDGMQICYRGQCAPLQLQVPGQHNVMNALASTAACLAAGVTLPVIASALSRFENIAGRLREILLDNGASLIDDSYNANPTSVKAAVDVLAAKNGDSILVLGDMGELGEDAESLHAEVGAYAKRAGITHVLAVGNLVRASVQAFGEGGEFFDDKESLAGRLRQLATAGSVVLVKGSRAMQMETVVAALIDGQATAAEVR